jgi:hypothetical protein
MDEALKDLWQAAVPGLLGAAPGDDGTGIYKYWRDNRLRLGSPVGPEHVLDGKPHQAFAGGVIVRWDDDGAKEI